MPMHRRNKCPRSVGRTSNEKWFLNNTNRQRKRFKAAKLSRRKNRQ